MVFSPTSLFPPWRKAGHAACLLQPPRGASRNHQILHPPGVCAGVGVSKRLSQFQEPQTQPQPPTETPCALITADVVGRRLLAGVDALVQREAAGLAEGLQTGVAGVGHRAAVDALQPARKDVAPREA
eukprot:CAMPEP_0180341972 /NCGR_PEP_ID=MMETSP0989-20121125/1497_1 /TAXON_ID=697907 /ORGANISM="non described non described, Strain CCMP2293" /LENGTH=127 /DNA_ID=CAMNT_0022330817 /DNA_START=131 /DNA_END=512 /DNA_ORIENTATION=-